MQKRLLPSGRVRYFPMCEYVGEHRFVSRLSGEQYEVKVRKKLVDATYLEPSVPASSVPPFEIAPERALRSRQRALALTEQADGYMIIGAGKTAIDACLWLLEIGVPPERHPLDQAARGLAGESSLCAGGRARGEPLRRDLAADGGRGPGDFAR